ncbi:MAG: glycosyltransferase, partial [Candidatus Dadabacteria bacterium]
IALEKLKKCFGITKKVNWRFISCQNEDDLYNLLKRKKIEVFVNHTHCSEMPNPCPIGLYALMFPHFISPRGTNTLSSYDRIVCNSFFTKMYASLLWGKSFEFCAAEPPLSCREDDAIVDCFNEKEKVILVVGRFNVKGHSKRQLEAIDAFIKLVSAGVLDSEWELYVVGHLNDGDENKRYFEKCKKKASQYRITVKANVAYEELEKLYRKATCLWQFTGVQCEWGKHPGLCEHLGLVALDCFRYGVIPIAYQRGGMAGVIRSYFDGFLFYDLSELFEIMKIIAAFYKKEGHKWFYRNALSRFSDYNLAAFRKKLKDIISGCVGGSAFFQESNLYQREIGC